MAATALPFVSFSSWVFLEMLARWSKAGPRLGGFDKDLHKRSARLLLEALFKLLLLLLSCGDLNITVELVEGWVVRWPRPPHEQQPVILYVTSTGVDLKGFRQQVAQAAPLRRGWWRTADFHALCKDDKVTPADFWAQVVLSSKLKTLHAQLLWHLGWALQKVVRGSFSKGGPVEVTKTDIADIIGDQHKMDTHLLSYLQCSKASAKRHLYFTAATDKSAVAGLGGGVQSTIFVLPATNLAILAPPQVSLRSILGGHFPVSSSRGLAEAKHSVC